MMCTALKQESNIPRLQGKRPKVWQLSGTPIAWEHSRVSVVEHHDRNLLSKSTAEMSPWNGAELSDPQTTILEGLSC